MDSNNKKNRNLFIDPHDELIKQGSIFLPKQHTSIHKEQILADAGLAHAASCLSVFGEKRKFEELTKIIRKFEQKSLVFLIARIAHYLGNHGMRSAAKDTFQRDFLTHAIQHGRKIGLEPVESFEKSNLERHFILHIELINSLFALAFGEVEQDGKIDANQEIGEIAFGFLILNDYWSDTEEIENIGSYEHYLRVLRQNLIQAPQLGGVGSFSTRMHRFFSIYSETINLMKDDEFIRLDEGIMLSLGVSYQQLIRLIFPVNVPWVTSQDFKRNVAIETDLSSKKRINEELTLLLSKISMNWESLKTRVRQIKSEKGLNYYKSSSVVRLLTESPFLAEGNKFVLLAPHLIIRSLELSIRTSFFKAKFENPEVLFGNLGVAYENYIKGLFLRKYSDLNSSISSEIDFDSKRGDGNELTDVIIDNPEGTILFEAKFRPPNIHAIDLSVATTRELNKWLYYNFSISSEEAKKIGRRKGGLWQLRDAAIELNKGIRGYYPKIIVPVIIFSEELIFNKSLQTCLDREVQKYGIFEGIPNITNILVISIGELEFLTSCNFGDSWNMSKIFIEKSTDDRARIMSWVNFLKRINLKYTIHPSEDETLNMLKEASQFYFEDTEADK